MLSFPVIIKCNLILGHYFFKYFFMPPSSLPSPSGTLIMCTYFGMFDSAPQVCEGLSPFFLLCYLLIYFNWLIFGFSDSFSSQFKYALEYFDWIFYFNYCTFQIKNFYLDLLKTSLFSLILYIWWGIIVVLFLYFFIHGFPFFS